MIPAIAFALRDLRRSGRDLWLLAACLFLGTAALAGIGSLSASIIAALDSQGRAALGGDLELRVSQRRATVEELAAFAARGATSESVRMRVMAEARDTSALVDLKAVDARWPLLGRLKLAPGGVGSRPQGNEIALAPALADRLGVRVGDGVRVGSARLRVIGLIADEPDRLGEGFRLGLPAIVDLAGLDATGLVQPGSLYESRYRMLLSPGASAAKAGKALTARFSSAGWSARTSDDATGGLRRGIDQLGQFLVLVGLAALAIASVGVGSGISAWLATKMAMLATLKVLGARSRTLAAMVLAELGLVVAAGVVAGLALGAAVPAIVARVAGDALPVPPRLALYPRPLLVAALLACLTALIAALPALARARSVTPATLLRGVVAGSQRPSWRLIAFILPLILAVIALAVLTASDRWIALGFVGATAGLVVALALLGLVVRLGVARLPRPRSPLARLALGNLHRPGAQTDRLVVALGLGFSLFVALAVIDTSLSAELTDAAPAKAPRFFAIDLQPEDALRFNAAVTAAAPGARIEATPSLRGTVVALNGRRVSDMKVPPDSWVLKGDRTLTWSARLPARNVVVAGKWWSPDYRGPPLVSLGADAAGALGLHVGDTITVAVLGVEVPARIAALRKIDWGGLGLNFAIIFSPGYIEEAPHALLASVYAPADRDGAIARGVAVALPSVTLIRVGDVIGQIGDLIARIILAVRAAAAVTIVAGIVVLTGAVAASLQARRRDGVLLKLLGGTRAQLLAAQAMEYGLLAVIVSAVALAVGGAAGWYVVTKVFKLAFAPDWRIVTATLGIGTLAIIAAGLWGSLSALRVRPAEALRSD